MCPYKIEKKHDIVLHFILVSNIIILNYIIEKNWRLRVKSSTEKVRKVYSKDCSHVL